MPFDKLDKKAREAAERYNAEYNEEAWSKMEALLDKHMPVTPVPSPEPARKRFHEKWLLLLLSLVIITSSILFFKPWQNSSQNNVIQQGKENSKAEEQSKAANKTHDKTENNGGDGNSNQPGQNMLTPTISSSKAPADISVVSQSTSHPAFIKPANKLKENNGRLVAKTSGNEVESADDNYVPIDNATADYNFTLKNGISKNKIDSWFDLTVNSKNKIELPARPVRPDASLLKNTKTDKIVKNNFGNSFVISLSAGPDVSAVDLNNVGAVEVVYGAGIGYKFAKRWMVRTGFYTVKKVYGAKPTDYNPPGMFWTYYPNLVDIAANCKVNEVPLIVNYTFSNRVKQLWFVSAGVSSYFMKRETYDYRSKSPTTGNVWSKSYTIHNEYKHYLASLRLSAGYQKTLSNKISISAEPYLNLPLSGVGYGKVKLNSAGLLLSLGIKPFAKK